MSERWSRCFLLRYSASILGLLLITSAADAADVDIALLRMGVGNHVRAGDPTAILVRATSSLQTPVQVRIEWAVPNADGDKALYSRDAALAPGAPLERWLYGVTPILTASAQSAIELVTVVRVLEIQDGRAVRVLGEKRIDGNSGEDPSIAVETTEGLIGVIGDGRAGLSAFATPTPNLSFSVSMNELTKIARGMKAGDLPDRWEGLASYDSIVWTNAPVQGLAIDQARALIEWTKRGGNLVIVLPESGDPWGMGGQRKRTALGEVLPDVAVRNDSVEVSRLLPVLIRNGELRNSSARTSIWTFPTEIGNGFAPLLLLPAAVDSRSGNLAPADGIEGQAVVVRRPLGFGFVTVIGIDVDGLDRRSLTAEGIPQADFFWNRILGRRADTLSVTEANQLLDKKMLETRGGLVIPSGGGELVANYIGLQSRAAIGILGLLLAFGTYWLLAGPGSFWALRASKRTQFAWLAFVAVAVVTTVLAWLTTGLFEFTGGRVQHLTFVDRVELPAAKSAEREMIRVHSWFSAALPGYGTSKVTLGKSEETAGGNLLQSFFPPPAGNQSGFPDTENYQVPAASQDSFTIPSRATSTELMASWVGTPTAPWDGTPHEMKDRRLRQDITWGAVPKIVLHGALMHSLPGPLEDLILIHVTPFHSPERTMTGNAPSLIKPSDSMPNFARMTRMARWDPETALDVATALYGDDSNAASQSPRIQPAVARDSGRESAASSIRALWYDPLLDSNEAIYNPGAVLSQNARINMLQLYSMLQPPSYLTQETVSAARWRGAAVRVERDLARQVDLSKWCSSPCLIVIGSVTNVEGQRNKLPFPFTIDDRDPDCAGKTYVRVVFPLPTVPGAMIPPLP